MCIHSCAHDHIRSCTCMCTHTRTNILSYTITHIKRILLLFKPLKIRASQLILYFWFEEYSLGTNTKCDNNSDNKVHHRQRRLRIFYQGFDTMGQAPLSCFFFSREAKSYEEPVGLCFPLQARKQAVL